MVHTVKTEQGVLQHSAKEHNLSVDELLENKENILALFQANGVSIPNYEFDNMVRAMDFSDSGNIERSEFVHGIVELCEEVRPMSIMELNSQVSRCNVKVETCKLQISDLEALLEDKLEESFDILTAKLHFSRNSPQHAANDFSPTSKKEEPELVSKSKVDSSRLENCEIILLELQKSLIDVLRLQKSGDLLCSRISHPGSLSPKHDLGNESANVLPQGDLIAQNDEDAIEANIKTPQASYLPQGGDQPNMAGETISWEPCTSDFQCGPDKHNAC